MSEYATPGVVADHALVPQVNDQQIDAILDDFRSWLHQAAAQGSLDQSAETSDEALDLHTLASHFTALRHEVNLQTKAVRAQQDQNAQTLEKLSQSLEIAQQVQRRNRDLESKDQDDQLRPLVKSVLDAFDSLALARREVERMQQEAPPARTAIEVQLPSWVRWLGLGAALNRIAEAHRAALAEKVAADSERQRRLLESTITGYTMSLQRLERTLNALDLAPIPAVGETFDPEKMEVVDVVNLPDRRNMEVVDEVRRGYFWRGRVFRFAQVRVSKC